MNDYLIHYGVSKRDGAKFGSGRYPLGSGKNPKAKPLTIRKLRKNVDIDDILTRSGLSEDKDFVIKKGTKLQRVSTRDEDDNHYRTYATFLDSDNASYLASWGNSHKKLYTFEARRDLRVAGAKARVEAMLDLVGNKTPEEVSKEYSTRGYFRYMTDKSKEPLLRAELGSFISDLFLRRDGDRYGQKYIKKLKRKGYDVVVDDFGVDAPPGDYYVEKPVVIIDRKKSLKTIKVSDISEEDVKKARETAERLCEKYRITLS